MTQLTEVLIQVALVTLSLLAIAAIVFLIAKNFNRLGFRKSDRMWSRIDDQEERILELERKIFPERFPEDPDEFRRSSL